MKEVNLEQLQLKVEELERLSQIAQPENTLLRAQVMRRWAELKYYNLKKIYVNVVYRNTLSQCNLR